MTFLEGAQLAVLEQVARAAESLGWLLNRAGNRVLRVRHWARMRQIPIIADRKARRMLSAEQYAQFKERRRA